MELLYKNIEELADLLHKSDDKEYICAIIWAEVGTFVRHEIAAEFVESFQLEDGFLVDVCNKELLNSSCLQAQTNICDGFSHCVKKLKTQYDAILAILSKIELHQFTEKSYDVDAFQDLVREAILATLPVSFNNLVYIFYRLSFNIFSKLQAQQSDVTDPRCELCDSELIDCRCEQKMMCFDEVNRYLIEIGLLDRLAGLTMTSLVQKRIKDYIANTCQGIFDRSHLNALETWLNNVVIEWLYRTFNSGVDKSKAYVSNIKTIIEGFKVKLTYFLYETFAWNIIEQFFSIIIDFPDSIPAIDDLKICIEKIDMRKHLIKALKNSLEVRVLHPGVNTIDILTSYVAAIKAIRHLDNSGVILETVTAPIKEYLRKRSDTVRRVVTGLTEEGPTDLSEELARGEALKENVESGSFNEYYDWEIWEPDPLGLENTVKTRRSLTNNRSADIISMIVDIYGTKELFVNEYRNLMADRLLSQLDFNAEKEIRNLELLKIRFGEQLLHSCEVMLKDVTDSKRINTHIQSDPNYGEGKIFELSSLIVSAQFWPPFNKESLDLPPEFANEFNKYTKSFEAYKGNRTLNWRTVTGRVNITVEVGNRSVEMTTTPTQAVILYYFQENDTWSLDELSTIMKVPSSVLRKRIGFWLCNGFLSEIQPGVFRLIEANIGRTQIPDAQNTQLLREDDDIDSAMASANDQREEELQVFWSYIVGMLTNLDSLPIDRIHQMLRLFASDGLSVEFTQDDLKEFLQRKVREHKLTFFGGVYQLPK